MRIASPIIGKLPLLLASLGTLLLCSCSTPRKSAKPSSVRHVDFREVPKMEVFAERTRNLGNEMYPKVCALLAENSSGFPRRFDVCFKKELASGNSGETCFTEIRLNGTRLTQFKENPGVFDQILVHEMVHVAQRYQRPFIGRWVVITSGAPSCWEEGIADYVCFKLGQTNGWRCPQCNSAFADYRNGYSCAAALLIFIEQNYNSNIVRQLHGVLRSGKYSDAFFATATGKPLPELWAEFKKTRAFGPGAAAMLKLEEQLGFVNGAAPKDVEKRFQSLVDRTDDITKDLLKAVSKSPQSAKNLNRRMAFYLYFTAPGGTAEAFLLKLKRAERIPGFAKGEKGELNGFLNFSDMESGIAMSRLFTATKKGDPATYHYSVVRASPESDWQLQRAWRSDSHDALLEEYPVH